MPASDFPVLGVVLAGGRSSRMGQDKATLAHPSGCNFLEHACTLLRSVCQQVAVSGRNDVPGAISLPDPVADQGPMMGVKMGVQTAKRQGFAAALTIPVDMPQIQVDDLLQLLRAHHHAPKKIIAASFDGERPEPLLSVFPTSYEEDLAERARSSDRSLIRWLDEKTYHLVTLPRDKASNLNTPFDLETYRRQTL